MYIYQTELQKKIVLTTPATRSPRVPWDPIEAIATFDITDSCSSVISSLSGIRHIGEVGDITCDTWEHIYTKSSYQSQKKQTIDSYIHIATLPIVRNCFLVVRSHFAIKPRYERSDSPGEAEIQILLEIGT